MPLYREKDNSSLSLPTAIQTTAQDGDYIFMIDGSSGIPYKITKANLLAGLPSGGGTGTGSTTDPYYSQVSLLLPFDGTNNSTTFTDAKGHTVNIVGSPIISTAQSVFGGSSLYLPSGSSLNILQDSSLTFGTNDFTWEGWIYPISDPSSANYVAIMGNAVGGESGNAGIFLTINAGKLILRHWLDASSNATSLANLTANTWNHVAGVKHETVTNVFLNGIMGTAGTVELNNTDNTFSIGTVPNNSGYASNFTGYIDEIRVTNGTVRYTSNFTVPTEAF